MLNKSWAVTTCVGFVECIKCGTCCIIFIKIILNRFLQFKQLGIVAENGQL